ncbi:transporter substrate-binding domain-containing protein [Brachybacterium phenoliresistens]|uniref:transporter substrate-binding domain-containing protein n=1 Tax=Brachybacterium phenoliresistens TaxID=396014 RepID=UPI0031CE6A05
MSTPRTLRRRTLALGGLMLPLAGLAACADPVSSATGPGASDPGGSDGGGGGASDAGGSQGTAIDTSGTQELIRASADPEIAALLPEEIAAAGVLRAGTNGAGTAPLAFLADDNTTYIGSEIDIARIVADRLGLTLDLRLTTWENWPLKLEAGEFDVVHANIGINAERLQKFDFASYRAAYMSFLAAKGADFFLEDPASVSGRIIAVGAATNQERILTDWNARLQAEGKEPAQLKNYSSDADTLLALGSGRIDATMGPYASQSFVAARRTDVEVQGRIDAGWPDQTLVAATFPAGSGLAAAYAAALNSLIADGTYAAVQERWGLTAESLPESRVHTQENP